MSLSGSTRTMNLADLLQWVASAQKTGRLDFRQSTVVKEVYLQEGLIVGAASNQPTEMLGHVLVARGMLTEEQLRAGLLARRESSEFLGQILVRLGFITRDDLLRALAERTEEIVYSLFEWDEADFHFEPDARPGPQVVLISLPVDHVLLRGVHRCDEKARIREIFPDGRVVLARSDKEPPEAILQHPLARRILETLDGRRSIDELAFLLHASPFPVMKFLYEAYRLGLATIVTLEGPPLMLVTGEAPDAELVGLTGPARIAAARDRLDAGDPEAAMALLCEEPPIDDAEAAELLEKTEQAFLAKVYRDEFPADAVPELGRPLQELTGETIRSEEYFLLSRLDGTTTVRNLVELAPMREAETIRLLRRLVRRGLVRLASSSVPSA
ncbi:MAG: DUF4388 domain-containing protein [Acidobacteriota bacterium]|nr:DUF4388 domain-containing protein [Acidobacteriota bacterium]MDQ7088571.1 DUF4388 domain-containing protein [Acidobacteriota bacterium]